jgi:dTDP-4-amino-4,6-dideoxygalactose transaminase
MPSAAGTSDLRHIPFALPDVGEDEITEVVESLRSGWLTTGPKTKRFEAQFAEFIGGGAEAIAVSSATAGLHLALEALGIAPGDEVIVPTFTFTATAEVVRYLGADPVFVDLDPSTLNMSPSAVARAITPRTRAVIPVHIAGLACDMAGLAAAAGSIPIVEDAAHALPCTHAGQLIGGLASAATVFSFYATKTVAVGEGGMVVTRDHRLAERCRRMRLHGIDRDAFDRYRSDRPAWFYEVVAPGYKYNMTDLAASLGIHQLRKVRAMQARRAEIGARYDRAFRDLPIELPPHSVAGDEHSWHLYIIRMRPDARVDRDAFITGMADRGVGTSVHFIPLHMHPYWRDAYALSDELFPNASAAYRTVVSLPIYSKMTDADVCRVIAAVVDILGGERGSA